MCGNKRRHNVGYDEQPRSQQSGKPRHMAWLPLTIILFFVFSSHSWGFVFQPWMWFLLPIAGVILSSCFTKTQHRVLTSNAGMQPQEILQQTERPYEQPYQSSAYPNAVQKTYAEGGQNFQYPQQQVQQTQYEEPYVDYPQPTSPMK